MGCTVLHLTCLLREADLVSTLRELINRMLAI